MEFEIKDYDNAVKKSEYKQSIEPATTPSAPAEPTPEPKIKQEPAEEVNTPTTPEVNQPETAKIHPVLKKLQSDLDGKAWECTDTHRGQRFRVRTTSLEEEDEYLGHWDNTIQAEENETLEEE